MILGYEDAKKVDGRFQEFEYLTIVQRNEENKDFACFKDNDNETFTLRCFVYCWNVRCFDHLLDSWNSGCTGLNSMYSYSGIRITNRTSYNAVQVLDRIYERNKFNYLPHLMISGNVEYIK